MSYSLHKQCHPETRLLIQQISSCASSSVSRMGHLICHARLACTSVDHMLVSLLTTCAPRAVLGGCRRRGRRASAPAAAQRRPPQSPTAAAAAPGACLRRRCPPPPAGAAVAAARLPARPWSRWLPPRSSPFLAGAAKDLISCLTAQPCTANRPQSISCAWPYCFNHRRPMLGSRRI